MVTGTRVDLHVKVLDERVVERAKKREVDVLVYAPHFTRWPDIRDRAAVFSDEDLLVVPGRELFTGDWRTRQHVLALDLEEPVPTSSRCPGRWTNSHGRTRSSSRPTPTS
jgi:Predicted metal-dependent phosphoesterases (PHP family)